MFLFSSILIGGLISDHTILHISVHYLRKCASTDFQSNYLPIKLPKPYHSGIFRYNWFLTPLLCVLFSETVYYICFVSQRSCLQIGVSLLIWLVLHILDIHLLKFYCVHLWTHAKRFHVAFLAISNQVNGKIQFVVSERNTSFGEIFLSRLSIYHHHWSQQSHIYPKVEDLSVKGKYNK